MSGIVGGAAAPREQPDGVCLYAVVCISTASRPLSTDELEHLRPGFWIRGRYSVALTLLDLSKERQCPAWGDRSFGSSRPNAEDWSRKRPVPVGVLR
jgi:hypothetical protein